MLHVIIILTKRKIRHEDASEMRWQAQTGNNASVARQQSSDRDYLSCNIFMSEFP